MTPDQLYDYLQRADQANVDLQGLNEQAARAEALRGSSAATDMMVQGQGSYLGLIADAINRSRGKQMQRDIDPKLAEARKGSALGKTMAQKYNIGRQYEKDQREQERYEQERSDKLAERGMLDMQDKRTRERVTLITDGRGGYFDGEGNPVNISDYVKYYRPTTSSKSGGKGGLKPSASERKDYLLSKRLQGVVNSMASERNAFTEGQKNELDSPGAQAASSILPSVLQRMAEDKMYSSPEVKSYVTRLNRVESKLSQLAAGLNVTGYEMKDRQRWSPNAPGITDEERQLRLNNIERDLFGDISLYEEMYPEDYHVSTFVEEPFKSKAGGETLMEETGSTETTDSDGFSVR